MKKFSGKRFLAIIFSVALTLFGVAGMTACGGEKDITVVVRDQGSGTREAFDTVVTDGNGNYLQMKISGKTYFYATSKADVQKETGNVLTKVASDINAIGYVSFGSINDSVKVVSVNGVSPSKETVLDKTYPIQRPFVIMTSSTVALNDVTKDFLSYLKSNSSNFSAQTAGCIFLEDPLMRSSDGTTAVPVTEYVVKEELPAGGKIIINGSTSMEKFIKKSMSTYASLYGKTADELFTLDLQGSSFGKEAVKSDKNGNVIGLSSAAVSENGIDSFKVCLDAVAVIVNSRNEIVSDLTIEQLYSVFTGRTTKFSQLAG